MTENSLNEGNRLNREINELKHSLIMLRADIGFNENQQTNRAADHSFEALELVDKEVLLGLLRKMESIYLQAIETRKTKFNKL